LALLRGSRRAAYGQADDGAGKYPPETGSASSADILHFALGNFMRHIRSFTTCDLLRYHGMAVLLD
jgi:hypothetical protein